MSLWSDFVGTKQICGLTFYVVIYITYVYVYVNICPVYFINDARINDK